MKKFIILKKIINIFKYVINRLNNTKKIKSSHNYIFFRISGYVEFCLNIYTFFPLHK